MFRHILLPVDGSALASRAVLEGVKFAKSIDAAVTLVFVALPYRLAVSRRFRVPETQRLMQARYEKEIRNYARGVLRKAQRVAARARVICNEVHASALSPCEGILKTARRSGCDLIAMASHGHGGVAALLLGSVTRNVLIQSRIPVLVYR